MPIHTQAHGCDIEINDDGLVKAIDGYEMIGNTEYFPNEWITFTNGVISKALHCIAEKCTPEGLMKTVQTQIAQTKK